MTRARNLADIANKNYVTASNGNLGIGSTAPSSKLDVVGNGNFTGSISALTISGTNLNYTGIATVGSLNIDATQVISSGRQLQNIASLDATTTATIENAIVNAPNTFTDLSITGVSTFTNGPVLVGAATTTGTASQTLQVTGGAYVSDNLGIGSTAPSSKLSVVGNSTFTGIVTATGAINSSTDVQINGVSVLTSASNDAVALAIALG